MGGEGLKRTCGGENSQKLAGGKVAKLAGGMFPLYRGKNTGGWLIVDIHLFWSSMMYHMIRSSNRTRSSKQMYSVELSSTQSFREIPSILWL